jgi:hypothetical protein
MRARRAAALAVVMLVALAASIFVAGPAQAGVSERIVDYRSDVTIEPNGTIEVHETIVYDFGVVPKHGIYRTIPVRTATSPKEGYDRVYPLDVVSVSGSADTPAQYTVEEDGDNERIKIGDPDRTISGEHTYDIVYRVRGAMNAFADHDELYWNVVGNDWAVPIEKASAVVHAPADITQIMCFSGPYGANLACDSATSSGPNAEFSKTALHPYESMTTVIALPKGAVTPSPLPILEERFSFTSAFRVTPATGGISGGLLALLAAIVIFLVWKFGRDRRYTGSAVDAAYGKDGGPETTAPLHEAETPVEFEPPEELRPGELGTLIDFDAGTLDVTATIIDLAVRGYLKIEEVEKEWYQFKHDWKLTKLEKDDSLRQYERSLYSGLFKDGDEVKISDLKNTFATRMSKVREQLMDDAMSKGWFTRKPGTVKVLWGILGIFVLVGGIALTILLAAETHAALLGVPVIIGGILLLIAARWMPKRTAKGYAVLRHTLGFKRFIDESEKHRAQFAERANIFSEYLPYAVVFGATEKWAKAFEGLADEVDTSSWYVSQHAFNYAVFSSAIDGFTTTSAGTLTSSPASSGSSGFGGGGFSGGGGGGGGGGSW